MRVLFTASNWPATPPNSASFPDIINSLSWSFVFTFAFFKASAISGPTAIAAAFTSERLFLEFERDSITAATFSAAAAGSWPAEPKSIKFLNNPVLPLICGVLIVLDITAYDLFKAATPSPARSASICRARIPARAWFNPEPSSFDPLPRYAYIAACCSLIAAAAVAIATVAAAAPPASICIAPEYAFAKNFPAINKA